MEVNNDAQIVKPIEEVKTKRGRPKIKTEEELRISKEQYQKEYMKTYKRDYVTEVKCNCGLIVLKCNLCRHKNSAYHKKHTNEDIPIVALS